MTDIKLLEELHSNTRRTRITFRALVNGQEVAMKCYRRPLFGLLHWLRAARRGKKLREVKAPVPDIIYSGWLRQDRCFCFATAFLTGYRSMREVLRESDIETQFSLIRELGRCLADIHRRGVEQPDGNLTNFLVNDCGDLAMVDEDDIRVFNVSLPPKVAVANLANVAARLPDRSMVETMLESYLAESSRHGHFSWDSEQFWKNLDEWRDVFRKKRLKRNIDPVRHFD